MTIMRNAMMTMMMMITINMIIVEIIDDSDTRKEEMMHSLFIPFSFSYSFLSDRLLVVLT